MPRCKSSGVVVSTSLKAFFRQVFRCIAIIGAFAFLCLVIAGFWSGILGVPIVVQHVAAYMVQFAMPLLEAEMLLGTAFYIYQTKVKNG